MRIFAIIFIIFGFAFHQNLAQTPEQEVIATARKLQEKPFDKKILKMRKKSLKWIYENRKFHLTCGISGHYLPTAYKFRSDLFAVFIIGTVAFYLENPDKLENEEAAKNSGLISMVRTYEQIIKVKPEAKLEKLDQLTAAYKNNNNLAKLLDCLNF